MKKTKLEQKEITIDAKGQILGRLAVEIANQLRGKNKVSFSPNVVNGDKIVVINSKDVQFTGNKLINKLYQTHSMWPSGFKSFSLKEMMQKDPTKVLYLAVSGMLPKNRLRKPWLKNLKIYSGDKD